MEKSNHNEREKSTNGRPRHRHSSSVDGSSSPSMFEEIMEAKKVMPPDKLAELWTIDFKRAKRMLEKVSKDPQMLADIFVNYDCDLEAPNLFERMKDNVENQREHLILLLAQMYI